MARPVPHHPRPLPPRPAPARAALPAPANDDAPAAPPPAVHPYDAWPGWLWSAVGTAVWLGGMAAGLGLFAAGALWLGGVWG